MYLRQRSAHRMPGPLGLDHAITYPDPLEQRVVGVGDRRGVIGQRHDLAFVFELAHVQQVRHVLEENAEGASRRRRRDAAQVAVLEFRDRRGHPVAEPVDGHDRTGFKSGGPCRRGGVRLVVVDELQLRMPKRASGELRVQCAFAEPA